MRRIVIIFIIIVLAVLVVVFYYMAKPVVNQPKTGTQEVEVGESGKTPSFDANDNLDEAMNELNALDGL